MKHLSTKKKLDNLLTASLHISDKPELLFTSCNAIELYPSIIIQDMLELLKAKIQAELKCSKRTNLTKSEVISIVKLFISFLYFPCKLGVFMNLAKGIPMGWPLSRLFEKFADMISWKIK